MSQKKESKYSDKLKKMIDQKKLTPNCIPYSHSALLIVCCGCADLRTR